MKIPVETEEQKLARLAIEALVLSAPNKKAKEEKKAAVKTFYTYDLPKKEKIDFLESKQTLEVLSYKSPALVEVTYKLAEKTKVFLILALKLLTVERDTTCVYMPKLNEFTLIPIEREFNFTFFEQFLPKESKIEKVEVKTLKLLDSKNRDLYNVTFDRKSVKDKI